MKSNLQQPAVRPASKGLLSTRRRAVTLCAAVLAAGGIGVALFPLIFAAANFILPPCTLNEYLGIRCPLCGGTRCVRALVELRFGEAFWFNPLVAIAALVLGVLFICIIFSCFRREYKPVKLRVSARVGYLLLAVYLLFGILRNLPFYRAVLY